MEGPATPGFLSINSQDNTPGRPRRQQAGISLREMIAQKLLQRSGVNSPLVSLLAGDGTSGGANGPQPLASAVAQSQPPAPPSLFAASYAQSHALLPKLLAVDAQASSSSLGLTHALPAASKASGKSGPVQIIRPQAIKAVSRKRAIQILFHLLPFSYSLDGNAWHRQMQFWI